MQVQRTGSIQQQASLDRLLAVKQAQLDRIAGSRRQQVDRTVAATGEQTTAAALQGRHRDRQRPDAAQARPLLRDTSPLGHDTPKAATAPPAPTQDPPIEFTHDNLQKLVESWGKTDSPFDLDNNGTVNVDDLLAFMQKMSPACEAPAATDPTIDANQPTTPSTTEAVLPSSEQPHDHPIIDTQAEPVGEPLTYDGLLAAWGESNSVYDLNEDGTVNVDDLLTFMNGTPLTDAPATSPPLALDSGLSASSNASTSIETSTSGVNALTDSLIDRLSAAGFDRQPPINIHELIDKLDLSRDDSSAMMKRLSARYPRGLGVNVVG